MLRFIQRYKWLLIFAVLLSLNVVRYWPVKHASHATTTAGSPAAPPGGAQAMDAQIQARIDAMPDDQKAAARQRVQEDRQFFASIQNIPQNQRMATIMQHFADNPPPPGLYPTPPPPGAGGGPGNGPGGGNGGGGFGGNGGVPPIPPPDVRRPFEQAIINGMRAAGVH